MSISKSQLDKLSQELVRAEKNRRPVTQLSERFANMTVPEAYAIQMRTVESRVSHEEIIVGKKIGLTSVAMQEMLGVREPDYGIILSKSMINEGEPISMSRLIQPRVESEICFILKEDLKGPGVTAANVLTATAGVVPAFEIIDSRFQNWKIKIQDTVADSASGALVVLGAKLTPLKDLDLRLVGLVLEKDGSIIATAAGAAVWGNPVQAIVWLANKLGEHGIGLHAGEFIMSGSLTSAFDATAGSSFRATFDRLGSVSTRFVE